jgi:Protein of unknown function (DUF2730)
MNEYVVWAGPIIALAGFAFTIYVFRSKRHDEQFVAISRSIGTIETQVANLDRDTAGRVDRLEDRVTRVESEIEHLPDKDVTHRLEIALTQMNGEMAAMKESIKPISAMAARIQEAIIEKVST